MSKTAENSTQHMGSGEVRSRPMSSAIDAWVTAEANGAYTWPLQGEPLEPGKPPQKTKPQFHPDGTSTLKAL